MLWLLRRKIGPGWFSSLVMKMFSCLVVSGIQGNCGLETMTKGLQGHFGVLERDILQGWHQVSATDTAVPAPWSASCVLFH